MIKESKHILNVKKKNPIESDYDNIIVYKKIKKITKKKEIFATLMISIVKLIVKNPNIKKSYTFTKVIKKKDKYYINLVSK